MTQAFFQKAKRKKRMITLMEMMVVIFLIGIITAVVAYNYRGTLEKGRIFKTEQAITRIENTLNLRVAENPELFDHIQSNWVEIIQTDAMVKDANALKKDGWGDEFKVEVDNGTGAIRVYSSKLNQYKLK